MEKTFQGKESLFDNGIMCLQKGNGSINRKCVCEGAETFMNNLAKLNVMFWTTLSLSISSNSVILQKKMDYKRKLQLCTLSLRHIQAPVILLEWPYNSKVI